MIVNNRYFGGLQTKSIINVNRNITLEFNEALRLAGGGSNVRRLDSNR